MRLVVSSTARNAPPPSVRQMVRSAGAFPLIRSTEGRSRFDVVLQPRQIAARRSARGDPHLPARRRRGSREGHRRSRRVIFASAGAASADETRTLRGFSCGRNNRLGLLLVEPDQLVVVEIVVIIVDPVADSRVESCRCGEPRRRLNGARGKRGRVRVAAVAQSCFFEQAHRQRIGFGFGRRQRRRWGCN